MAAPWHETLRLLYERHAGELAAFARRRVGPAEAADVVQDTYLRLARFAGQVALENPRAYLHRIAAGVAADRGAAARARAASAAPAERLADLEAPGPGPDQALEARRRLARCLAALQTLPPIQRHAFLLHRIDGLTQPQVSTRLGIPLRTVERYVANALAACLACSDGAPVAEPKAGGGHT